jgi:uncharacterized repeat protein (TIGR01451 family)
MRKSFLKICVGLAFVNAAVFSGVAAPAMMTLSGHVPAVVSRLQPAGLLPATTNLHLAIGLPLRNQAALTSLLREVYDPSSPNYHHYLTPDEFTAQFGPTEQDYQKVVDFAGANGLSVDKTHPNRMLLDVSGKVADIQKALHITMHTYHHPTENRVFFSPDTEPTVDATLPILNVSGLNNYLPPHPMFHKISASSAQPANGSGPGGGYMGSDFRNAYVPGSTLTGSGQIVGLLQFDGYYASDIATYEGLAGLTNVPLQNVLLDGFNGTPGPNNIEVCLDIEDSISMAPGLSKVVVFEGYLPDSILSSMASSNQIKQLSASWGYPVDATTEQLYQELALQGQTFFNASGDGDAWANPGWPVLYNSCDNPYITIVGGTTLTMNGNGVSYASEQVWNAGFAGDYNWNPDGYAGSSGGISVTYSIPSWQTNISMTANKGSTTMRNVPDVALTADNVFIVANGGEQGLVGGTSCASPLWAGFMALVNQQAAANNVAPPGFINPAVYAIATGPNYPNCFHDIINGNNTWPGSPNLFYAVTNYDLCTGVGTPNGTNLINALAASVNPVTHLSPPPPPFGTNLAAMNGSNPNGTWSLFIQDDRTIDSGVISNGWVLTLTTANMVGFAADNVLGMTASPNNVVTNGYITFYLTVTNFGPSDSSNVMVVDTFPTGGFTLISSNLSQGSLNGSVWTLGTLSNNFTAQLSLTVKAPNTTGSYNNSAVVSATTPDPNLDENSASVTFNVVNASPPQMSGLVVNHNGTFQFTVTGVPGQEYIVQASTNLFNWVPVYTNPPPYNSPFTYTNSSAVSPGEFYRVVTGP